MSKAIVSVSFTDEHRGSEDVSNALNAFDVEAEVEDIEDTLRNVEKIFSSLADQDPLLADDELFDKTWDEVRKAIGMT